MKAIWNPCDMNPSAETQNHVPGNDRAATLSDQGNDDRVTPDPAGIHFGTHNVYYVKLCEFHLKSMVR